MMGIIFDYRQFISIMAEPQQFISQSCSWFHVEDNYPQVLTMQTLSGIGINRLGSFQRCIENVNLRYFLMSYVLNESQLTRYTGICYSNNCTSTDLIYITKSINEYLPLPFHDFTAVEPFSEHNLWNPFTVAFFSMVSLLVMLCLVSSALYCFRTKLNSQFTKRVVQYLSLQSTISFLFHRSSSNERIKVISGLRAIAFFGMTLYNLISSFSKVPSFPSSPKIELHLTHLIYFFDVWLLISGFYHSFQLSKHWSKDQSIKNVIFTFIRKSLKIIIVSFVIILCCNAIAYGARSGPLWTLILSQFQNRTFFLNIFNQHNYWLWIWIVEIEMCFITSLLFLLWHRKFSYHKIVYAALNIIFIAVSFILSIFFGHTNTKNNLQGRIQMCPIVSGVAYLMGFNLGLMYFFFRASRIKSKLLIIRMLKYKITRIAFILLAISLVFMVYVFFLYWQEDQSQKSNVAFYQLFRIIIPLCYSLIIIPELLGFQSMVGTFFKDRSLNIVSKLSFTSYTAYYTVIMILLNYRKQDLYVNTAKVLSLWICSIASTMLFGIIFCLLLEIPLYRVLHTALGRNTPRTFIQFY